MAKYKVVFASSFEKDFKKLDKAVQKQILNWIQKHLMDVDFPTSPGKSLKGELRNYVRFRVGDYRIISYVDNDVFVITNLHVGHRKDVYK
ncbi:MULTISPECIES: type II toxin-antitoxin system RelE family toxin [Macrococcoides]|uniref:Type II toxin-antitoxin system RelE/ParE family toxin n=1 Tax=Macrococcoides goetzii TaxID=1891097 RepID=A0A395GAJ3_9STAP|nr:MULTISPECIES: type II toxin-antitoxin system RelE/ParE family toxin [Macrococcus]QRN48654.1 type II toxin-antitoxin system RelE/ParE family toxin [Macrococcus bohemicus]QYA44843.1 type II toxin-antitoxin system RelE/ParE family toxin [Macrococcus bohemicus]RAI81071.1 type II toxin-antitoxin system RelE/ParE family toxin [Macrococcus goetzii]